LATAAGDHYARIWDLVTEAGKPPGWLPDLVQAVAGAGPEPRAGAGRPSRESVHTLRSRLLSVPVNDNWSRWLSWFLADRATRNVSPLSAKTVDAMLQERLDLGDLLVRASFEDLIEAIWIQPNDGNLYSQAAIVLASQALAEESDRLATVERFSRLGLELRAETHRGLWARASCLDLAGDHPGATAVIERIIAMGFDNAYFWLWSATFFEKTGQIERGAFAMSKVVEVADRLPWDEGWRKQFRQMREDYLRRHGLAR